MADNLQKLIALAKADGGKFFVLDEKGQPTLVMMSVDEYENLLVRKMQNQAEDIEEINRKIAEAARQEAQAAATRHREEQEALKSEIIDSTFLVD